MSVKDELLTAYKNSRAKMMVHLNEIDKNRKIYPLWTIREIIAHLSGWDDAAISFLEAMLKGETPPTPAMRGIDVYNEETVSTREGLDYDHIVREYEQTREKLIALINQSSDDMLLKTAVLPWGGEGTFKVIAEDLVEHEIEHAEDVKKIIQSTR